MWPRDLFRGLRGWIGEPGGQGGHLGDPMGPSGLFAESPDDS